jgi:sterol desaturase/sphingolipid hydroxylase (fatty acid hydroxylase superfamily)
VATQLAERPLTGPLARLVERRGVGLVPRLPLPPWARTAVAVLLLDYTLYLWHVLLHRVPFLWRHHKVHHADLDMDASTALRFHAGELLASAPWRMAQVVLIGVTPRALALWQRLLLLSVMFHHSNVRLPRRVERWLGRVVMTPRLHGIHHSIVLEEQDSNWSSGLTLWDALHGTLRDDVAQEALTIGVAAYRRPADVTLPRLMTMPYDGVADTSRLPDGTRPRRAVRDAPRRAIGR